MKKIFLLLILFSCSEVEENKTLNKTCFEMTISDAIPVQFWVNDQPTFNEKNEAGIEKICYNQKWNADDEIKIQVLETSGLDLRLKVYDDESELLTTVNFEEVETGVYEVSIIPEDEGITSQLIKFHIVRVQELQALSGWINYAGSPGTNWVTGANPTANLTLNQSKYLIGELIGFEDVEYSFNVKINMGLPFDHVARVEFLKSDFSSAGVIADIEDDFDGVLSGTPTDDFAYIAVHILNPDGLSGSDDIETFTMDSLEEVLAYTDLMDIQEDHEDTRLISYTNNHDYAGIEYDGDYPPTFNIRIESKFYEPRLQGEEENEPISTGEIVELSFSVQRHTLFETDPLPPYMHDKLSLIFGHNTKYIGNYAWARASNYEVNKMDDWFGLFLGKIWLVKASNSFVSNVN